MKKIIQGALGRLGYALERRNAVTADMDRAFVPIHAAAEPYSMTTPAAMYALYKAVEYVVRNDIGGSFVECGVWRGGSSMVMALTLQALGAPPRDLYLFDTFEGMTPAGVEDVNIKTGEGAAELLRKAGDSREDMVVAYAGIEEVQANMRRTGYPRERLHFVPGDVARTLPATETGPLALLRLDTDWYDSTLCELDHLYPRLVSGGVLIIDDYGSWAGARKAVDEYVQREDLKILLNRVDTGMRIAVKP